MNIHHLIRAITSGMQYNNQLLTAEKLTKTTTHVTFNILMRITKLALLFDSSGFKKLSTITQFKFLILITLLYST